MSTYQCNVCNQQFTHHLGLNAHTRNTHKPYIERFIGNKAATEYNITRDMLTDKLIAGIEKIMGTSHFKKWDYHILCKLVINQSIDIPADFLKVKSVNSRSLTYYQVLFGIEEGSRKHQLLAGHLKSISKAHPAYWIKQGFSEEQSQEIASEHHSCQSKKGNIASVLVCSGNSNHTVRSCSYWINQGFSQEQAEQKVKDIQTANGLLWYQSKYGDEEGQKLFDRRIQSWKLKLKDFMISNDYWRSDDKIKELERYRKDVTNITRLQYIKYKELINPDNLIRGKGFELDHRYSITAGFNNKISPGIIGHWTNLEILVDVENNSKWIRCSVKLEELIENIKLNQKKY